MTFSKEVLDFWEKAKSETGVSGDFVDAWGFGDNPELMDELLRARRQHIVNLVSIF